MFDSKNPAGSYTPIKDNESLEQDSGSSPNDHLLTEAPIRRGRAALGLRALLGILAGLLAYTAVVASLTTMVIRHDRIRGTRFPSRLSLDDYLVYEQRLFLKDPRNQSVRYFDPEPSKEIDKNWHELLDHQNIAIPAELMGELGRLGEGVKLPDGNYFATPMMFHSLHCLKALYRGMHTDYYTELQNLTRREQMLWEIHTEHCLDMLRQTVECTGDMTLLTMRWKEGTPIPTGNFSSPHECVNRDRMMEWVKARSFDALADGVIVHPTLGPLFVGGKSVVDGLQIH